MRQRRTRPTHRNRNACHNMQGKVRGRMHSGGTKEDEERIKQDDSDRNSDIRNNVFVDGAAEKEGVRREIMQGKENHRKPINKLSEVQEIRVQCVSSTTIQWWSAAIQQRGVAGHTERSESGTELCRV
ncbi:unnamed protein product [Cercopithifilaria johnstoni]|uniref:Uncharacterized protein n=1 Tax=Cercopithifilaria johnstoni TaxID=2874296 RepID=A0A8J2LM13_9BILA|nr:unnamed protein product [Cercopithifilaria johnstoni]